MSDNFKISANFEFPMGYDPFKYIDDKEYSTEHPNVTVQEYRNKPKEEELSLYPFFQCIDRNSENLMILASNSYRSRICNGNVFGFEDVDEDCLSLVPNKAKFKAPIHSPIVDLKFINDTTFLLGENDGRMTLYSTRTARRVEDESGYCLFTIGNKVSHNHMIYCMDIFQKSRKKAISGDEEGGLVIWDVTGADLVSINEFPNAHTDAINAVTTSIRNDNCFVTASNDKTILHWDLRDQKPASMLMKDQYQLKACVFLNETQLLVGDKTGNVSLIDVKMPKKIIFQEQMHDCSVHKFIVNGQNVIILSDSNNLQVKRFIGNNLESILNLTKAPDFLRSAVWINDFEFYVIGWSSYLRKYKL